MADYTDAQQRVLEVLEQGPAPLGSRTEGGAVSAVSARKLEELGAVVIDGDTAAIVGGPKGTPVRRHGARLPITRR